MRRDIPSTLITPPLQGVGLATLRHFSGRIVPGRDRAAGRGTAAWLLPGLIVALFGILALPQPVTAQQPDLPITAIVAETGRYATNGRQMRQAYVLAVERVNKDGGIKVGDRWYRLALSVIDDESSPIAASRAAERVVRDRGRRFLLGPYGTGLARAVAPVIERYGAVMVEAAGAVRLTETRQYRNVFSLLAEPGNAMAEVVRTVADAAGEKAADLRIVLAASEDWVAQRMRSGAMDAADETGMTVVAETTLLYGTPDLEPLVDTVRRERPDILLMISQAGGTRALVEAMADKRFRVGLLAATDCALAGLAETGAAARGVVCPAGWHRRLAWRDPVFGTPEAFARAYEERYRRSPSANAAAAAAAVTVLVEAVRKAGSVTPQLVRDRLAASSFETLIGPVTFDAAGRNTALKPPLLQYGEAGVMLVGPTDAAPDRLEFPGGR